MPRMFRFAGALACVLAGMSVARAQTFSNVVSFGDSLSDGGNFVGIVPGAQGRFTTNPDKVAIELVAQQYGYTLAPSGISNTGGWNFAWGGAPTGAPFLCVPTSLPCRNGTMQLADYFARVGGRADPNALYSIWFGANNVFNAFGSPTAQAAMAVTVQQYLGLISSLQSAGARYIVVYNLPDIGRTPLGAVVGPAGAASVSQLVGTYNAGLSSGLAQLGDGIIPINVFGLINEVLASPGAFGIGNVTGTACGTLSGSLFCAAAGTAGALYTYAAGSNQSFLFADGVHPTGATHRLLAELVIATISAPGQFSMAGEMPLQVYEDHAGVINGQIFHNPDDGREVGASQAFGGLQVGRQQYSAAANTSAHDSHLYTVSFGADYRYSETVNLGAAVSIGGSNGHFAGGGGVYGNEVLASIYGVWQPGGLYLDAIGSAGGNGLDVDRAITLGTNTRTESGNTNAGHYAFESGVGYLFRGERLQHGPYISATWQRVDVNGYREHSDSSTAMHFDGFVRESLVGRVGYQLKGAISMGQGSVHPFGRVAYARESKDQAARIRAGSNSIDGTFSIDGFTPSKDWVEADLGLSIDINDHTQFAFSYRGHLNDDAQSRDSLNFGLRVNL